jgi:hypothetical protein
MIIEIAQISEGLSNIQMLWTKDTLLDCKRTLVELLGLTQFDILMIEIGKLDESLSNIGVIRPKHTLLDC